jgi:hypothetical protein
MQFLAKFVMQGQFQAILVAGILGIISQTLLPVAILCCSIIALYLLRKGEKQGLPVLIATLAIILISSQFVAPRPGIEFPLVIAVLIPTWICAQVLRKTASLSLAIATAIACAAAVAISFHVFTDDAVQWWKDWLQVAIKGVQNTTYEGFEGSSALKIMNGMIAMMLSFATISSLLMARWLQATLYQPGGFKEEFHSIRIPKTILMNIVVVLIFVLVINDDLFLDLLIVFSVLYFFHGLSVFHCNVARLNKSSVYLLPPYLFMIFIPQFVIIGLAGLGLADTFINFRKLPQ